MSILLEALRKSEKSQRPVAAPTIHTDEPESLASGPMRAVPVTLLIVAALLITAWLAWRQYKPAVEVYQPPVTLEVEKSAAKSVGKPDQESAAIKTPVSGQEQANSKPAANKTVAGSAGGKRTPVESYTPAAGTEVVAGETEKRRGQTVKRGPDTGAEKQANQAQAKQAQAGQKKGGKRGRKQTAATKPGKPADSAKEYQSPQPEPISYWELPDAVRDEVPEIKFSVLVYADTPADRFVLMNGQRLGEGDSYQDGLVVKEIRRDGVVFSYRLYQFLIRR